MCTTPERGFEYFPSPETDDDQERIAYAFLYCTEAVKKWPGFRRRLIRAGRETAEQCDHIEVHVISVFKETRDTIELAIETDDVGLMPEPRLLERFMHAHALLALYANPGSTPEYRNMILGPGGGDSAGQPKQADFEKAVWEAEWDIREGHMPAQATRGQARSHRRSRSMDGLYNSQRRLDSVANAGAFEEEAVQGPTLLSEEKSQLIERKIESLIRKLRGIAKRVDLNQVHTDFLVEMAVCGKQQKDNPTAWRAIRGRKSAALYPEIVRLVDSIRKLRENSFLS